jgi:hypothetical protein
MNATLDDVRRLAVDLLDPRHFQGRVSLRHHPAETLRWEMFQGRLLDEAHTRQERTFESWNVHHDREGEPILSLKLDASSERLHVVRGVENYVWEGYDSGSGVYLSRERPKWVRELIGSFPLRDEAILRDEVAHAIARAVTGTRLPLTPMEAPLPAFSFGKLYYRAVADDARALEFDLRSRSVEDVAARWTKRGVSLLKQVFQNVSLSPYTDFVDRVVLFLAHFPPEEAIDFEGWLLRLVARHLTAYDLVTFHHRGANYPDALLLDAVLTDYLARMERAPELFTGEQGRLRRRSLRQAYLMRRHYEALPVPDVPTSPGEHARVYGEAYPRVPEEQLLHTIKRKRRLYSERPLELSGLVKEILAESVRDLTHPEEREELGTAVYLDRPFGGAKAPVEPDGTLLLASVGYSRSIAAKRLQQLGETGAPLDRPGVKLDRIGGPVRQSTLSLSDAARAASDFVFRYTLPGSVKALVTLFDFGAYADRFEGRVLVARSPHGPGLVVYDDEGRERFTFEPCYEQGYASRRGLEWPVAGVRVVEVA